MSEEGFRVVDKRRFTETGAERENIAETNGEKPGSDTSQPGTPTTSASNAGGGTSKAKQGDDQIPSIDFSSLVVIYATQAMTLLGEIPEPQSGQFISPDLTAARQIIDILALLQEKTNGNLTAEESKLVQDVLTKLRLAFVEKARHR